MTAQNNYEIENQFDANNELETIWHAKSEDSLKDMVCNIIYKGVNQTQMLLQE